MDDADDTDAIYQDVVQRLREVSVNVAAARKGMFRDGIEGLTEATGAPLPPTLEEQFEEVADLDKLAEQLVDVAIRQLARITWRVGGDYLTLCEAIEEADAEWLHQVAWERAERGVRAREPDAWRRDTGGGTD
jgi:hypothetical protein